MSIVASEVKFYKAANNNDLAGNGGVISSTEIVTNVINNLFPNVTDAERTAGVTRYRKMFMRNLNTAELILYLGKIWISIRSTAGDYFRIRLGTDTDIQSDAELYSGWKGAGLVSSPATAGDGTITVEFDTNDGVADTDTIRITDGVNTQDVVVNGAPVWGGNAATLTLTDVLTHDFAVGTRVGVLVSVGHITPDDDSWTENAAGDGVYDETTYPLTLYNVGTITDSWTLTFADASNFSVVGASEGSVGSGDINTDFQPVNGGSYYFKLDKNGWGGTWAAGDTITFNTIHSGQAIWVKEIVPAGVASYANNTVTLGWKGESASTLTTTTTTTTTTTSSTFTTTTT